MALLTGQGTPPPGGALVRLNQSRRLAVSRERSAGADTEEAEHGAAPERQDGARRRDLHGTDGGAVGLAVTARQHVLGEQRLAAIGMSPVAAVALEREDAVERRGPGETRVVADHGAGRDAHAAADAPDRGGDGAAL